MPKIQEKNIVPLTPREVEKLQETARLPEFRDMRLSLALMLYGGIRPAEVCRLQAADFNWEEQQVIVRPTASKTGGGRVVPLRGVRTIRKQDRVIPKGWLRKWSALRRAAGYFRNLSELQLEMGHRDTSLPRSRYMMPTLKKEAAAFWKAAGVAYQT